MEKKIKNLFNYSSEANSSSNSSSGTGAGVFNILYQIQIAMIEISITKSHIGATTNSLQSSQSTPNRRIHESQLGLLNNSSNIKSTILPMEQMIAIRMPTTITIAPMILSFAIVVQLLNFF